MKKNLEEKKGVRDELKTLEKMAMHKVQDKTNTLQMYTKVLFMTDFFMLIGTTISHTCYNLIVEFALISYKSYRSCASKIVSSCPLEFPFSCPCNLRSLFSTSTDGPCSNQKNHLTFIVHVGFHLSYCLILH